MKKVFAVLFLLFALTSFSPQNTSPKGAFMLQQPDGTNMLVLLSDNYYTLTAFNPADKKFLFTWGGPFVAENNQMSVLVEFDSRTKETLGQKIPIDYKMENNSLVMTGTAFKELAATDTELTGCWRIAGRVQNGQKSAIPKRARKTLKILTGNRFQWMAINTETGDFSGTGGGTYQLQNGIYTETIDFFSRDSSRVGLSLAFEAKQEAGLWQHKGKSSKGDPVEEEWLREKQ